MRIKQGRGLCAVPELEGSTHRQPWRLEPRTGIPWLDGNNWLSAYSLGEKELLWFCCCLFASLSPRLGRTTMWNKCKIKEFKEKQEPLTWGKHVVEDIQGKNNHISLFLARISKNTWERNTRNGQIAGCCSIKSDNELPKHVNQPSLFMYFCHLSIFSTEVYTLEIQPKNLVLVGLVPYFCSTCATLGLFSQSHHLHVGSFALFGYFPAITLFLPFPAI